MQAQKSPLAGGQPQAGKKKLSDNYYHASTGGVQPLLYGDFIECGHRIFGLHRLDDEGCGCGDPRCSAAGKHPVAANWQHTPIWSDEQIEAMEMSGQLDTGYGVLVAHGLLVVDIDARNGGVDSYQRLVDAVPEIAGAGLIVETGSGGGSKHLYFTVPSDAALRQHMDDYKGIDFKSSGFVVGPGSLHASGRRYEVLVGSVADIAPAPQALIDLLRKPDRVRASVGGAVVDYTIAELRDMVMAVPNDGDVGHEVYIRVGMALHEATGGSGDGFNIWIDWAKQSPRHSKAGRSRIENRWHSFGKATNPVTIGTLVHYAEQAGWCRPVTFEDHTEWQPVGRRQTGEKKSSADTADEWSAPEPLVDAGESASYPLAALPDVIRDAVVEVASHVQAPIGLVASSALAAVSLACQSYTDVERDHLLTGPVGAFFLVLAKSGERKSSVDGFFTRTHHAVERQARKDAEPEISRYRADLKSWDAAVSGLQNAIRKFSERGEDIGDLQESLRQTMAKEPQPPKVQRFFCTDATPEALASILQKWPAVGLCSSEAGTIFGGHSMSDDSVMRTLAMINRLWDGRLDSIDRKTTESTPAIEARLTASLMIQAETLQKFFAKHGDLARGSGFLARFLICWPKSTIGDRPYKSPPSNMPMLSRFDRRIADILDEPVSIDEDGNIATRRLKMTAPAKTAWIAFHDAVEQELGAAGDLADLTDFGSKLPDNCARLAALFAHFDGRCAIEDRDIHSAGAICLWHVQEAKRFVGAIALPADLADASRLDSWLVAHCRQTGVARIARRDAQRLGPIRDGKRLTSAIAILAENRRIRIFQKVIELNPELLR